MKLICECGNVGEYQIKNSFEATNGNLEKVIYHEGEFEGFYSSIISEHHGIVEIACRKCDKEIQLY